MKAFLKATLLSLLFGSCLQAQEKKTINILSVNDMHASIEHFPKLAYIVDSIRKTDPELLIFSAGDNRTGNPLNDRYEDPSYPMTALMNAVGFNGSAIGNHEFDATVTGFRSQSNQSNFKYICANIDPNDTLKINVQPFKFFERNGVRIGVLGIIQRGTNGLPDTHPNNIKGIKFYPEEETIAKYKWMREQCDILILLTHCGFEADVEFAKKFPYFDLIIGGHSHTKLDKPEFHNGVLITQTENKLKYVSHTQIEVENHKVVNKTTHLVPVKKFNKSVPEIQAMVDKFSDNKELQRPVVTIDEDLTTFNELGYLLCDGLQKMTDADIAIQNFGGIRYGEFPKGTMTVNDLLRLDPFGNEAVMYELTGEELKSLLIDCRLHDEDRSPVISGAKYEITIDKKNNQKVKGLKLFQENGKAFDMKKRYKVVVNSYIASICDFPHEKDEKSLFKICSDLLMEYLENQKHVNYKGKDTVKEIFR